MTREHPMGLTYHPNWRAVRDRWNERYCNAILAEHRPQPTPFHRTRGGHMILSATAVTLVLMLVWWVGMQVAG